MKRLSDIQIHPPGALWDNFFSKFTIQDLVDLGVLNLELWLRADSVTKDGSDRVSQLTDLSGNSRHFTAPGNKPKAVRESKKINSIFTTVKCFFTARLIGKIPV